MKNRPIDHLFMVIQKPRNPRLFLFNYATSPIFLNSRTQQTYHLLEVIEEPKEYRKDFRFIGLSCDFVNKTKVFNFKDNLCLGWGHQSTIAEIIDSRLDGNPENFSKELNRSIKYLNKAFKDGERRFMKQSKDIFEMLYNHIFDFWDPKTFEKRLRKNSFKDFPIDFSSVCDVDLFLKDNEWHEYFKYFGKNTSSFSFMLYFFAFCERTFNPDLDDDFYKFSNQYLSQTYKSVQKTFFSNFNLMSPKGAISIKFEKNLVPKIDNCNTRFFPEKEKYTPVIKCSFQPVSGFI